MSLTSPAGRVADVARGLQTPAATFSSAVACSGFTEPRPPPPPVAKRSGTSARWAAAVISAHRPGVGSRSGRVPADTRGNVFLRRGLLWLHGARAAPPVAKRSGTSARWATAVISAMRVAGSSSPARLCRGDSPATAKRPHRGLWSPRNSLAELIPAEPGERGASVGVCPSQHQLEPSTVSLTTGARRRRPRQV